MDPMVTLITGTSTGIGRVTALHLARRGHHVHATMRSPDRGAAPLLDAARAEGLRLTVSQLDVIDPASVESAISAALRESGRIDVLVNNAGVDELGVIERTTEEQTHASFETNVLGPMRAIRAVLPGMRERRHGTIVNVSSAAARVTGLGSGVYSATKCALEAIVEALAIEVKQFGIRVAVIEPGFFDTPIIDKATGALPTDASSPYADVERRIGAIYQGGKAAAGDPSDVAEVIERAITTDEPKFRYLVGLDAVAFADGRARMTDEEYQQAFGRAMTDDEFFTEFATRFPLPARV